MSDAGPSSIKSAGRLLRAHVAGVPSALPGIVARSVPEEDGGIGINGSR